MRTRIKVCCIASAEEARLAIEVGADALGFVAAGPGSPRTVADEFIADTAAAAPPPIATFLLTAEQTAAGIADHVRRTRTTAVQILNHIHPDEAERLAAIAPFVRRVQVIHVEGPEALDLIPTYAPHVHAFLLDSGRPYASSPVFGGTGQAHDWDVSAAFVRASQRPVFLAGGLSAANAAQAIRQVRPFGLDLCSGVRSDGRLDVRKLTDFISAVRRADDELAQAGSVGR
jgi:phosphoribosylanthranilate isomerase